MGMDLCGRGRMTVVVGGWGFRQVVGGRWGDRRARRRRKESAAKKRGARPAASHSALCLLPTARGG